MYGIFEYNMTLIIVAILLFAYVVIATSWLTKVNRAAVAMFAGAVGWVLYICYGTDFVVSQHPREYVDFLAGAEPTARTVKMFISQHIFLSYVGKGAEIVLFLLATMSIVEILNNNGCFDFLSVLLRSRNSKKLLWMISAVTFLISANLDNLTTTTMMLVVMHKLIANRRQRMVFGSAIVIAANCGGALTVIGDTNGLLMWNNGAIDATNYSSWLAVPCLLSLCLPVWWLSRKLTDRVDTNDIVLPYRGDDTKLNIWQRILMLFVGIGGLWFIPTFHNITRLSPFLGALCVLSLLWIVNEVVNRKLMDVDKMIQRRVPRVLQYGVLQMIMFTLGIMLALGVAVETGVVSSVTQFCDESMHNVWGQGILAGFVATFLDTFATLASFFSLHGVMDASQLGMFLDSDYLSNFVRNGLYWKIIGYSSSVGGNFLLVSSMSGLALMKMERIHIWWYFRNAGFLSVIAWVLGLLFMWGVSAMV